MDLLLLVLVPLGIGFLVRGRSASRARRWHPRLVMLANVALASGLLAGIAANHAAMASVFRSRVLVACLLIVALALAGGFAIGGMKREVRTTTGLVSGLRFSSLGLVIINTELGAKPTIVGPAIVFALTDVAVCVAVALVAGRWAARRRVRVRA